MKFTQPKLAVIGSGTGTNFDAIHAKIESGDLPAEIVVVIADNPDAKIVEKAKAKGIPAFVVSEGKDERDKKILELVQTHKANLVLLLGYLKLIREPLLSAYKDKIINIHPGPLPATGGKGMWGLAVHQKVIDLGLAASAATMHYVNDEFDEGAIIASASVPVEPNDTAETLRDRVMKKEYDFYWQALKENFCK